MSARILVVEDRESLRRLFERALGEEGYEVTSAADVTEARARLAAQRFDLVLTDLMLPDGTGLEVLSTVKELAEPQPPVVVLTAFGTVATAVEAMKSGAVDFLEKPVELPDLYARVRALLAAPAEDETPFAAPGVPPIVGSHPRLRAALRLLERVAATDSTVLLTGASGTGKELFARSLHALSPRRGGPFVAVNCAAIPETLIENELFGHERGAFTGADRRRPGRLELAERGTLFLDEVGDLPPAVQPKVLRALEEKRFERVGGATTLRADVRIVAATNRDLGELVAAGGFRSDLLFRLEVFPIALPSLAERKSDLPALARHLLAGAAERHGVAAPALAPAALARLASLPWPGNVRQLANVLERLVILHPGATVGAGELEPLLAAGAGGAGQDERERLRAALASTGGDKRRAADLLGVSYRTVLRRVRELDLEGYPRYRDS